MERDPNERELEELDRERRLIEAAKRALPGRNTPCFAGLRLIRDGKPRDLLLGPEPSIGSEVTILDWRTAPLANVFFIHKEGETFEVDAGERTLSGTVDRRALFTFEAGELVAIDREKTGFFLRDGVWRARDGLDRPLLSPRPKELRASEITGMAELDPAQRAAVELPHDRSVLVLGEAGFGKTTVALHRVVALDKKTLVIVPTRGLELLSKRILERLGARNVKVSTFDAWIVAEARRLFKDLPERDSIGASAATLRLKRHPALRDVLPQIAAKNRRRKTVRRGDLLELFGDRALLERAVDDANGELPRHAIDDTIEHTKIQFTPSTERAHSHVDRDRLITADGRPIDEGTPLEDADSIDPEDCAVLFELHRLRSGEEPELAEFDHLLLDEAQEFAPIELAALRAARAPNAPVTVAGDAQQQTDDTASFPGWEAAMKELGAEDRETVTLLESYRCPPEVTRFARSILAGGPKRAATDGALIFTKMPTACHQTERLIDELRRFEAQDPRAAIAVITKTSGAARSMFANLRRAIAVKLALGGDFDFRPGIVVTSIDEVKGLEFDLVVLPDVESYGDDAEGRRALYVALTRSRHQVWIT